MDSLVTRLFRKGLKARIDGHSLWVDCPFCVSRGTSRDTRQRLGIELKGGRVPRGVGHCYNCGYRSKNALAELFWGDETVAVFEQEEKKPEPVSLPDDFDLLADLGDGWSIEARRYLIGWSLEARRYLISRGLTDSQIVNHRVGLSMIGKTRARVIFPIWEKKKLLGWSGRTILPKTEPKWLHSPGLRNMYWAAHKKRPMLVLTEGIFDALAVERAMTAYRCDIGALLGLNLSPEKESQITAYDEIVLFFDPDPAGLKGTASVGAQLDALGKKVSIAIIEPVEGTKGDPGELSNDQITEAIQRRQSWSGRLGMKLRMVQ